LLWRTEPTLPASVAEFCCLGNTLCCHYAVYFAADWPPTLSVLVHAVTTSPVLV
jgi:hypothetical protein